VTSGNELPGIFSEYHRRRGIVEYDGFYVPRESLTKSDAQLKAIKALTHVQRQFVGTMIDTEVAAGYFRRVSYVSGDTWVAYVAVKMKYGGDLKYLAQLISHLPPSRHLNANTIKGTLDLRWSLQVQGIVAYALLGEVRAYLHNEKSIVEVDCILKHGPTVNASEPHPFIRCGAIWVRRGVWFWPQIDEEFNQGVPQRINSPSRGLSQWQTNQNTKNTKNTYPWDRASQTQSTWARNRQMDRRQFFIQS